MRISDWSSDVCSSDLKGELAAGEPPARRAGLHITRSELDLGAEGFERLQVQVDRPVADRAAAGQADRRLARARQPRAEDEDRRAHLAHDVRSEEHKAELQSLMRITSAVFCFDKKN